MAPSSSWRASARWFGAGHFLGCAAAIKVTGVLWIAGALFLLPSQGIKKAFGLLAAGIALAASLFFVPVLWKSPLAFFEQVILFQFSRPADGDLLISARLASIFGSRHIEWTILMTATCYGWTARLDPRLKRSLPFFVVGAGYVGIFLTAKTFWGQYNAGLAPTMAILAGLGTITLSHIMKNNRWIFALRAALFFLLVGMPFRSVWKLGRSLDTVQAAYIAAIRAEVTDQGCLFTFEPAWHIMANVPLKRCGAERFVIDPYMVMIRDGVKSGKTFDHVQSLWQDTMSQRTIMSVIDHAQYVFLGPRGELQLNQASKDTVNLHFKPTASHAFLYRHL